MLLKYSNRLERLKKVGGMMKERYDKIEAEEPAKVQLLQDDSMRSNAKYVFSSIWVRSFSLQQNE